MCLLHLGFAGIFGASAPNRIACGGCCALTSVLPRIPPRQILVFYSPSEVENSPLRDRIQKTGTTKSMDKKSKKTSKKHPAGKEAARSEKSDPRPALHETTPEPPLLRHGEMENPTSVGSPAPTDPGVDHPCGDSPVQEAIRSAERTIRHQTSSAERQVHPRVGDQTLRHRDEFTPLVQKRGGQPSDRQPSRHQTKAPRREKSPRRSRADQHSQDRSRRRSKEREGRTESTYSTYHLTGQQRRPSPKMFGRIHCPSPPKDLSQARQHQDFRGDEGKKRRRRKKSKADRREPRPESRSPDRFRRRSRSPRRDPDRESVDYSDLTQQGPLPETFERGPTTRAPRAETTVSRPPDVRRVEESPLRRTVVLTQQDTPRQRVQTKQQTPVPEQPVTQGTPVQEIASPGDQVPAWFAPVFDRMMTMFASQHPPTTTPTVTVQSPVAVSPPDNPTSPTLPEDASQDRLRRNIRITPDAEMELSEEEEPPKQDEVPVVTRSEQPPLKRRRYDSDEYDSDADETNTLRDKKRYLYQLLGQQSCPLPPVKKQTVAPILMQQNQEEEPDFRNLPLSALAHEALSTHNRLVLGVDPEASEEDISCTDRKLADIHHHQGRVGDQTTLPRFEAGQALRPSFLGVLLQDSSG